MTDNQILLAIATGVLVAWLVGATVQYYRWKREMRGLLSVEREHAQEVIDGLKHLEAAKKRDNDA